MLNDPLIARQVETQLRSKKAELARPQIEAARKSLLAFTTYTFPSYTAGRMHELIAGGLDKFLAQVEAKKSPRLIFTMPPRHGNDRDQRWPYGSPDQNKITVNGRAYSCAYGSTIDVPDFEPRRVTGLQGGTNALRAMPKFGRERVPSGHRTTTANRSFVTRNGLSGAPAIAVQRVHPPAKRIGPIVSSVWGVSG